MEREIQQEPDQEPAATQARPVSTPSPATDRVVQLQRSIGNRQTRRVLAREETKTAKSATRVQIGTLDFEVLSVQMGSHRQGGEDRPARSPFVTEASFTSEQGEHSSDLFKLVLDGTQTTARVVYRKGDKSFLEITFKDALVTSYSVSGHGGDKPMESWSINFASVEYKQS